MDGLKQIIKDDPSKVNKIPKDDMTSLLIAFQENPECMTHLELDDQNLLELLLLNPKIIPYIPDINVEVQVRLVQEDPPSFMLIKNPEKRTIDTAVARDGYNIQYVKDPTKEQMILAVRTFPGCIEVIKDPCEEVIKAAITGNAYVINRIDNPSMELLEYAVSILPDVVQFIPDPSDELWMLAIEKGPHLVRSLPRISSYNLIDRMIELNPESLNEVRSVEPEIWLYCKSLGHQLPAFLLDREVTDDLLIDLIKSGKISLSDVPAEYKTFKVCQECGEADVTLEGILI